MSDDVLADLQSYQKSTTPPAGTVADAENTDTSLSLGAFFKRLFNVQAENTNPDRPVPTAEIAPRLQDDGTALTFAASPPPVITATPLPPETAARDPLTPESVNLDDLRRAEIKELLTTQGKLGLDQVGRLQELLNEDGHSVGNIDKDFGAKTAAGVVGFLKDNPDMARLVSPEMYASLINNDPHNANKQALRGMVSGNETLKAQIVESTKNLLGTDPASMSDGQKIALQTNLSLLGHYDYDRAGKQEIDGTLGKGSRRAIDAFRTENGLAVADKDPVIKETPSEKLTQSFTKEADKPHIGLPRLPAAVRNLDPESFITEDTYGLSRDAVAEAWRVTLSGETPQYNPQFQSDHPIFVGIAAHNQANSYGTIDPGAVSPLDETLHEADINRALAQASVKAAYKQGFNAVYVGGTENTPFPVNYNRDLSHIAVKGAFAHNLGIITGAPIIAVNHETNAIDNIDVKGARVYAFTNTKDDAATRPALNSQSEKLAREMSRNFQTGDTPTLEKTARHMALRGVEKGVIEQGGQNAAITVESGFLTNPDDVRELKALRDNPVNAGAQIAQGAANYYNGTNPQVALAPRIEEQDIQIAQAPAAPDTLKL
ncbi:MAG: N-acetylmuramoyl-L-alanine amidase [Rhodospirillales bacterium]|nr:N-acetylmuramoyl-L-alanine amidase [Rhodospirillales bacterium]